MTHVSEAIYRGTASKVFVWILYFVARDTLRLIRAYNLSRRHPIYVVDANKDGMDRLNKDELADSVVGGRVEECQYVYLTSGRDGLELGENSA